MERIEGVITQVVRDRGFAFVRGSDKQSRFFHARNVDPLSDFDILEPGGTVSFTPIGDLNDTPRAVNNGLKAINVRLCQGD